MKRTSLIVGTLTLALAFALVTTVSAQSPSSIDSSANTTITSPTVSPMSGADTTSSTTTTPGLPDTGVGGNAAVNFMIILASGLLVVGGTVYALREFAR
jgi:hypothetical protein